MCTNAHIEQPKSEEFSFPFSQEPDLENDEMFSFCNDNPNIYNLRNRKDPFTNGIPLTLQPTPPNPRESNNLPPIRLVYGGQQN